VAWQSRGHGEGSGNQQCVAGTPFFPVTHAEPPSWGLKDGLDVGVAGGFEVRTGRRVIRGIGCALVSAGCDSGLRAGAAWAGKHRE
jgi:hypothetical protein